MHYGIIPAGGGIAQAEEKKAKAGQIEELESITVTSTKTQHTLDDVPEETIVITAEELNKLNVTNTLEALRWIPGLDVNLRRGIMGPEDYGMNESKTEDVLLLIDGNRTSGKYPLSEVPVSSIERIEIVKGGNSVLYGSDALAGVINIITKKPTDKVTGGVKMVVTQNREDLAAGRKVYRQEHEAEEAFVGFSTANLRHLYNARRDYTAGAFEGYNVGGKWGIDLNDEMNVGFGLIYNILNQGSGEENKYSGHASFDWKGDGSTFKFKTFYRDNKYESNTLGLTEEKFYEQELLYSLGLGDANLLTVGYQNTVSNWDNIKKQGKTIDDRVVTNSVFLQDELTLFDILTFVPAVRVHSHDKWNFHIDPKLSILWKATDTLKLRLSGGTAYKAPSGEMLYNNFTHGPMGRGGKLTVFEGNPDLKPEKSKSIRLSAEQRLGNFFIGNIALFRTEYENQIGMDTYNETMTKKYIKYKNEDGKTIAQGVELSAKYWLTENILLGSGYTYFDTEDKDGKTLENTIEHRVTPAVRYQDDEWGLVAELRGNYEKYANQSKGKMGMMGYEPGHDELNGPDNFQLSANLSKQLTNSTKVWMNGENLLKRKKSQGMSPKDLTVILGLECKF